MYKIKILKYVKFTLKKMQLKIQSKNYIFWIPLRQNKVVTRFALYNVCKNNLIPL